MAGTQRVVIPYAPRSIFVPFHNRRQRYSVIVCHRRAGKTVAHVNDLIKAALVCDKPEPRFAYLAPYYAQAKDAAWSYLKHFTAPIPGVQTHEGELRVDLPNGGRVRLYGADNYDRLRGIYLDGAVLDEYAMMDPRAWSEVIRPALADREGWACFIGTPKGKNAFYRLYRAAQEDPEWYWALHRASETGIVPQRELDASRKAMTAEQYDQEFECSFEAAILGSYYGREMQEAERAGRIGRVPWEPNLTVETWWDLGIGDSTAIWFVQTLGREVRVIDYYEHNGVGLDHYAKVLAEKPYTYSGHLLPHDAQVRDLSTGRTRLETLKSLGLKNVIVGPKLGVDEGINAARVMLPRSWFDAEKCARGIEALKQHRRETLDESMWETPDKPAYRDKPLHDWTSHGADAFRYGAVAHREAQTGPRQTIADGDYNAYDPPTYRGSRQTVADDYSPI